MSDLWSAILTPGGVATVIAGGVITIVTSSGLTVQRAGKKAPITHEDKVAFDNESLAFVLRMAQAAEKSAAEAQATAKEAVERAERNEFELEVERRKSSRWLAYVEYLHGIIRTHLPAVVVDPIPVELLPRSTDAPPSTGANQ